MYRLEVEYSDGSVKIEYEGEDVLWLMVELGQSVEWLTQDPRPVKWQRIKVIKPLEVDGRNHVLTENYHADQ